MFSYFTPRQTESQKRDWRSLPGEQMPNWGRPISFLFGLICSRLFFRLFALLAFVAAGAFSRLLGGPMREPVLDVKKHASCGNCGVVLS